MKISTALRRAAEAGAEDPKLSIWAAIPPVPGRADHDKACDFFSYTMSSFPESNMLGEQQRWGWTHADRQNIRVLALLLASHIAQGKKL